MKLNKLSFFLNFASFFWVGFLGGKLYQNDMSLWLLTSIVVLYPICYITGIITYKNINE